MNPYQSIDLSNVINAAGKMTYLGSSAVSPAVAETMARSAQSFVDMASLKDAVCDRIAGLLQAEGACLASCAAAGIAVSVAACLTGNDLDRVESLPEIKGAGREVIVQKGHVVHFGANLTQMIRMTGASVREIGTVNGVRAHHLRGAIGGETAAVLYVVSHHAVSNEMLSLREVVEIAEEYGVPVIVDAAAEVDLSVYYRQGASLVVYSGHKAIGGPTSGLILGRKPLIEACRLQDKGYARAMKIGKENIMGLYAALQEYMSAGAGDAERRLLDVAERLQSEVRRRGLPGVDTRIAWDATRPIPRLQLIAEADCPLTAKALVARLEAHRPSVRTRNHLADSGIIQFDPRELKPEETAVIADILAHIVQAASAAAPAERSEPQ